MPVLSSYRDQSICIANQLTGFYMTATLAFNGLLKIDFNPILNPFYATDLFLCPPENKFFDNFRGIERD